MTEPRQDGFEFQGVFYPFKLSDSAKDLMLIDRLTGMAVDDFFEIAREGAERGPLLLALVATSIRAANPAWSVERIMAMVTGIESVDSEITLIEGDVQEDRGDALPPAGTAEEPTSPPSVSPPAESSPSSTPRDNSASATLSVIRQ